MTGKQIYDINNNTLRRSIMQKYFLPRFRHRPRRLIGSTIKIKNNYLKVFFGREESATLTHVVWHLEPSRRPNQFPFRCSKFRNHFMACRQINCSLIPICYCVLLTWFCVLLIKINNCRRQVGMNEANRGKKPVPPFHPTNCSLALSFASLDGWNSFYCKIVID